MDLRGWYICGYCAPRDEYAHPSFEGHYAHCRFKTRDDGEWEAHEDSEEHVAHFAKWKCTTCNIQLWTAPEWEAHCRKQEHRRAARTPLAFSLCGYKTDSDRLMAQHKQSQKHLRAVEGKTKEVFECTACSFRTPFKSRFDQHLLTEKHQRGGTLIKDTAEWTCEACQYTTPFKHCLAQHCLTQKHKNATAR
jgi:hypothetical protein